MACLYGSTNRQLYQFLTFGCLAKHGFTKGCFFLMLSPLAACPHASTLGDLFDYKDGGHVVIITNLDEHACEMNMKVANFKRSNMLALLSI